MNDYTEQDVYKAFGLESRQEPAEGAQVQDVADPAPAASAEPAEGAQAQDVADPAMTDPHPDTVTPTEPTAGTAGQEKPDDKADSGDGEGKKPLTPEQRREFAARRRQQEQQAAIDAAVQNALQKEREQHNADMAAFFAKAGLKNSVTGEAITTMEQFNAWNEQFQDAKLQRDLKAGKLTQEGLAAAISNHPTVKQAQQMLDQNAAQKKQQDMAAARARIDAELEEIHAIDASVSTLEDLFNAPYGKELYAMTQRGYSIKDAHYLLTKDTLEAAKLEAARQAGLNSARSKDHLNATGDPRGGGAVTVPKAEMEMYRLFNPTATAAQIQEHYNKNTKH
ncbi:MAG: hypothetical protein IJ030_05975 [Oscillospiraceae bacterium]|nr:hypothetical protein [Oscillospiraceae bacterium]